MTMSKYRFKGASTGLAGQAFALEEELWLGSGDDCQVVIKEPEIGARHVRIYYHEGRVMAETQASDAKPAGQLWVNGEAVVSCQLASGDEVRLGSARLVFQAPGLRPSSVLREEAKPQRSWGWVIAGAVIVAAAAAAGAAYWYGLLG